MKLNNVELKREEEAIFLLRALFEQYGYVQYKMNKFEEYDLYVENKDFLISDGIITFTDTNGKLMALKPDVTLSIIKNLKNRTQGVEKVYYNENVYRVSNGSHSFKEIMQAGIECMGQVDDYCLFEVVMLAAKSLAALSDDVVLDISHFGMLTDLMESFGATSSARRKMLVAVGEKNIHELARICRSEGMAEEKIEILSRLVSTYGAPSKVLPQLRSLVSGLVPEESLLLLEALTDRLEANGLGSMVRIDFSVVNDLNYYNGVVFKGFVKGIPSWILSGGQYDRLMGKMHRKAGAVGFAVYLDLLQNLTSRSKGFDVDAILLYDNVALSVVDQAMGDLIAQGKSVMAQREKPEKVCYRELYQITEEGVKLLERNA